MKKILLIVGMSLALSACGGSGGGDTPPIENLNDQQPTPPPPTNVAPIANAGTDQVITLGETITLSAKNSSDEEGSSLIYIWTLQTAPGNSDTGSVQSSEESFEFTPDVSGEYNFSLTVNDGEQDSEPVKITIFVNPPLLSYLLIEQDYIHPKAEYFLDASNHNCFDATTIAFSYRLIDAPEESIYFKDEYLLDTDEEYVLGPKLDSSGIYTFELELQCDNSIHKTTSNIQVNDWSDRNIEIDIRPELHINEGVVNRPFSYQIKQYIFGGISVSYSWKITKAPEGSSYQDYTSNDEMLYFFPDVAGEYDFEVSGHWNGELVGEYSDKFNILEEPDLSRPISSALTNDEFYIGQIDKELIIDLSNSFSPIGEKLTYELTLKKGPSGAKAEITRDRKKNHKFAFKADEEGWYTVETKITTESQEVDSFASYVYLDEYERENNSVLKDTYTVVNQVQNFDDINQYSFRTDIVGKDRLNQQYLFDKPGTYTYNGSSFHVNRGKKVFVYENIDSLPSIADAGGDLKGSLNSSVLLKDEHSHFESENTIKAWSIVSSIEGANSKIESSENGQVHFVTDMEGEYVIQLSLYDNGKVASYDHLRINIAEFIPNVILPKQLYVPLGTDFTVDVSEEIENNDIKQQWLLSSSLNEVIKEKSPSIFTANLSKDTVISEPASNEHYYASLSLLFEDSVGIEHMATTKIVLFEGEPRVEVTDRGPNEINIPFIDHRAQEQLKLTPKHVDADIANYLFQIVPVGREYTLILKAEDKNNNVAPYFELSAVNHSINTNTGSYLKKRSLIVTNDQVKLIPGNIYYLKYAEPVDVENKSIHNTFFAELEDFGVILDVSRKYYTN
ncbi:PKD domain-containing protein [Thalassotalea fonticola]|uniref:PKD domain-containing protein n=1 Tax=Thalassotalea fonticola TaxID=3065649 RepID=A0ABZ0GR92_9GAMM|nr:PKD domain-containing protein [Colwelliaceae bacterium S1-1]